MSMFTHLNAICLLYEEEKNHRVDLSFKPKWLFVDTPVLLLIISESMWSNYKIIIFVVNDGIQSCGQITISSFSSSMIAFKVVVKLQNHHLRRL